MTDPRPTRTIDLSIEVPGTPEEVWATIATGPGISSWFVPHAVEERDGGAVEIDFGPDFGTFPGTVTAWEPPHRFVYESGGDRSLAYEWLVEGRSGDTCVVRLVNSGFGPGEDWDADYDGMSMGWPLFLENLRIQLTHFRGRRARALVPTVMTAGPNPAAWARLCGAFGVPTDLVVGDQLRTTAPGAPVLAGRVESVLARPDVTEYHLLLAEPAPGHAFLTAEGRGEGDDQVACSTYLYLYADAGGDDPFTPWLKANLAQAVPSTT